MDTKENILVVDDESEIREIIVQILRHEDYNVDETCDGEEAIERLQKKEYDLLLTDLKMPKADGLEVIEKAKSLYSDIITIIMTGFGTLETAVEALKLGANDYIQKPFHAVALINTIVKNLINQRLSRENIKLQNQVKAERDKLKKKVLELLILQNLGINFSYTFSYTQLFLMIFESLEKAINYDIAGILDVGKRELTIDSKDDIPEGYIQWLKEAVINEMPDCSECDLIPDGIEVTFTSEIKTVKDGPQIKSYFNTVLWVEDTPFGIINVASFKENAFSNFDKTFLFDLAKQSSALFSRLKGVISSQREKLQFIIDNLPDGIIMYSTNDGSLLINPAAKTMIERRNSRDIEAINIEKRLNINFSSLLEETSHSEIPVKKQIELKRADDTVILEAHIANLKESDGLPRGLVMVFRDVTAEQELKEMKKEFISNVSHELRTPAAVIKEFLSIMKDEVGGSLTDNQKEYVDIMSNNIERLLRLIENLLNVSRTEAGTLKIKKEKFDITKHMQKIAIYSMMQLKKKNITLVQELPDEPIEIYADQDSVTQIITNLIDNAKKFSKRETTVTMGAELKNKSILIWVKDQGRGIPPEHQKNIFTRFFRIEPKTAARQQGAGLGLPIVKELIELHNGKIEIESTLGKGTIFYVTLPLCDE